MLTQPTNTNACTAHDFSPSLYEPGLECCTWCGETREAPAAELDEGVRVVLVAVEARRAA